MSKERKLMMKRTKQEYDAAYKHIRSQMDFKEFDRRFDDALEKSRGMFKDETRSKKSYKYTIV